MLNGKKKMEQKVIDVTAKAVSLRLGLHIYKEAIRVTEEQKLFIKKIIATVKAKKQAHHNKFAKNGGSVETTGKREECWRHNNRKFYLSITESNIMDQ